MKALRIIKIILLIATIVALAVPAAGSVFILRDKCKYSEQLLSADEIKELAAYVRAKYPNTSLYEYLKKSGAMSYSFDVAQDGRAYILTSTELETKEKDAGTDFLGKVDGALLYDCTVYAKGINIYDSKCEEESI